MYCLDNTNPGTQCLGDTRNWPVIKGDFLRRWVLELERFARVVTGPKSIPGEKKLVDPETGRRGCGGRKVFTILVEL